MTEQQIIETRNAQPIVVPKEQQYIPHNAAEIDQDQFWRVMELFGIEPGHTMFMLPFTVEGDDSVQVGRERRFLYIAKAVGIDGSFENDSQLNPNAEAQPMRILSLGECNVCCPYCKRGAQFVDEKGIPIASVSVDIADIARMGKGAIDKGEVVRFSGGDPVTYPKETLALASYFFEIYGVKSSIAHNGSGPKWVKKMAPYLASAAIDLKAVSEKIAHVMGIRPDMGSRMYSNSLQTQRILSHSGVLVDVRTPIFGDTSVEEIVRLGKDITTVNDRDHVVWTWRLHKPVDSCPWDVPTEQRVTQTMQEISKTYPALWFGMRAKWEPGGMLYVKEGRVVKS